MSDMKSMEICSYHMKDLGDGCGPMMPVPAKKQCVRYEKHVNLESSRERFRRWLRASDASPHEQAACQI